MKLTTSAEEHRRQVEFTKLELSRKKAVRALLLVEELLNDDPLKNPEKAAEVKDLVSRVLNEVGRIWGESP